MKRFFRQMPFCVAVSVMTWWGASNQAQVLDLVPSDALVVFRIKNLTEVNDKVAALAKQWGLVEMEPQAADPLGAFLKSGGITKGVSLWITESSGFSILILSDSSDTHLPSTFWAEKWYARTEFARLLAL